MPVEIDSDEFERLVWYAMEMIPPKLAGRIENLSVEIAAESPPGGPTLLGLYEGVPLTARGSSTYMGFLPDRVTIYRGPILRMCSTREEVVNQVRITVIHEIGHYFGIDDDRLHELGWA